MSDEAYLSYMKEKIRTKPIEDRYIRQYNEIIQYAKANGLDMRDILLFYMREKSELTVQLMVMNRKQQVRAGGTVPDGVVRLLAHQEQMKQGLKIAYKHGASAKRVMELRGAGRTQEEIADELGVSVSTVRRRIREAQDSKE